MESMKNKLCSSMGLSGDLNVIINSWREILSVNEGRIIKISFKKSNVNIFGTIYDTQNDLIFSVAEFMKLKIKKEVNDSKFISIILNETTDITTMSQLSTTLNYMTKSGTIEE